MHLIKRSAGATGDVVSIAFHGGCNWKSWIEKPEQSPRRGFSLGTILMGATSLYPHTGPFDMKFMQNDRHFLAFDTPHVGTDTADAGVTLSSHAQRLFYFHCGSFAEKKRVWTIPSPWSLSSDFFSRFFFIGRTHIAVNAPLTCPSRKHFWHSTCHETQHFYRQQFKSMPWINIPFQILFFCVFF